MTFANEKIERAFGEYTRKPAPAPTKSITYTDPHTCPYCQEPMRRTQMRKLDGAMEPVYLCADDRAVGVVPDSEITA